MNPKPPVLAGRSSFVAPVSSASPGASVLVNLKGDPMKNGSVQRASKRSYMDEATLAAMAQAIANLGSEVGDIKARAEADAVIAAKAAEQVRADLCATIADLGTMLGETRAEVALLKAELAGLTARVDPLGALVNAMALASSEPTTTEPTCDHGFIGACAECDGSGQTPENDAA